MALGPGTLTALLQQVARAAPAEPPQALAPGAQVGRYEVIREIGRGGFGAVYEAHDAALNRLVALKIFPPAKAATPDAAREGEAAARLAHPAIAAVHDAGVLDGGATYLVYELLHGETLEGRLARGPLPPRDALHVAAQVALALAHAHRAGVVHRDLKPSNVFLGAEGDVKVLDFGVALLFGRAGPSGGTPAYMAPEQRRGGPEDGRTDLFALGLLLREMLGGSRGDDAQGSLPEVPPRVQGVLSSLLAEDPSDRPRSARAALAQLEAAFDHGAMARPRRRLLAIAVAMACAAALGGGLYARERLRGAPATTVAAAGASIAVLPFADMSPGRDQEYFADGVAEQILTALAQVEGLRVAGRTSSFSFKGRSEDLRRIGRALGVEHVLEGSVRKAGERVRVTAQIVKVGDGYHLWAREFDRDLTDIFAVEEEIARAVVEALRVRLLTGREAAVPAPRATRPEVHAQYLIGRSLFVRGTPDGYRRAADAYEKALALDPEYAPAWAGLAYARVFAADYTDTAAGVAEGQRRGLEAAEKAVSVDPASADGYAARAAVRTVLTWDWAGAQADLERALALGPGNADTHLAYAALLDALGRPARALEHARKATELDPLAAPAWRRLGYVSAQFGRYDLAREALTKALEIAPEDPISTLSLGWVTVREGRAAEALRMYEQMPESLWRWYGIAVAQHELGRPRESRRALATMIARWGHSAAFQIAEVHAWRGEREAAFEWLERAVERHDPGLVHLKRSPSLRSLHDDPRYGALVQRMNLPAE